MFNVIDVESGAAHRTSGGIAIYPNGPEAAKVAVHLTRSTGKKHKTKRVIDDSWKQREQARFADGTYAPLPAFWTSLGEFRQRANELPDLFPHVSLRDPTMVAFTENPEKGMADVQSKMKPGKFLKKYFGVYGSADIRTLVSEFGKVFENNLLQFAETAEDIVEVYTNGPSSCMDGRLTDAHPSRVYAAGDLQVAFMKRGGSITARALVWPERKTHSRIYGDIDRLHSKLKSEGYRFAPPLGAKIKRIDHAPGYFVAPYIDKGNSTGEGSLAVMETADTSFLVISLQETGSWPCNQTTGITAAKLVPIFCCSCNAETNRNEAQQVAISSRETAWACNGCLSNPNRFVPCRWENQSYIPRTIAVPMHGGRYWCSPWYAQSHVFMSDYDGHNYRTEDRCVLHDVNGNDNRLWTSDQIDSARYDDRVASCSITGQWWWKSDLYQDERTGRYYAPGVFQANLFEEEEEEVQEDND